MAAQPSRRRDHRPRSRWRLRRGRQARCSERGPGSRSLSLERECWRGHGRGPAQSPTPHRVHRCRRRHGDVQRTDTYGASATAEPNAAGTCLQTNTTQCALGRGAAPTCRRLQNPAHRTRATHAPPNGPSLPGYAVTTAQPTSRTAKAERVIIADAPAVRGVLARSVASRLHQCRATQARTRRPGLPRELFRS